MHSAGHIWNRVAVTAFTIIALSLNAQMAAHQELVDGTGTSFVSLLFNSRFRYQMYRFELWKEPPNE